MAELAELRASVSLGAVQRADLRAQLLLQLAARLQISLQLLYILFQTAHTITTWRIYFTQTITHQVQIVQFW